MSGHEHLYATRQRLKIDDHRIIDETTGRIVLRAHNSTPQTIDNDRYHLMLRDNNPDYFKHDKRLGSMDSTTLVDTAHHNIQFARVVDDQYTELGSQYYELAASALWEAAFVQAVETDNDIESADDRLRLMDISDFCLRAGIEALGPEQTATKHRLELKLLFGQVHRDIVCGEITEQTIDELLPQLDAELYRTIEDTDEVHARGLAGEIRALLEYWSNYSATGHVAIPATVRGDSGYYNRSDTHDFDVLSQAKDGRWQITTPREIKRRRITSWMRKRYTGSDLVYAHPLHGVVTVQTADQARP